MTNEEIEAKAAFLADNLLVEGELDRDYLSRMMRALVSQAYEEAEKAVLNYDVHMAEEMRSRTDVARTYSEQAATRVRRLKDSLASEIVST